MKFKHAIHLALAGSIALHAGLAQAKTPIRFSMDWTYQGSQAIWFVAQEAGCFNREGLDVRIDRGYGAGDVLAKVAAGAYDIGFSDFNTLIDFNGKNPGNPLQAVFIVYDATPSSIGTLKKTGIAKPADLMGKTIASPTNDASRVLFPLFAQANGIDPGKVKWSSVSPELRESMLVRGQADAIGGHVWTQLIGMKAGGIKSEDILMMPYAQYGVDTLGSLLVTKASWAQANGPAVTSFIRCVAEGINGAIADPPAAIAALKKQDPVLNVAVETDRLLYSLSFAVLTDNVKKNGLHAIEQERFDRVARMGAEIFNVPVPERKTLLNESYLPDRDALKIRHELTMQPR